MCLWIAVLHVDYLFIQLMVVGRRGRHGLRVNKQQVRNVNAERERARNRRRNSEEGRVTDRMWR